MDWTASIDSYCERTGPEFWSEPINAVTNLGFLLAACVMAWRLRGTQLPLAWGMVWVLAAIGIGSFLFHTFATPWAALADTVPILCFVLLYIFAANRDYWQMTRRRAALVTLAFLPFAALTTPLFAMIPGAAGSAAYMPVPTVILIYAALLRRRAPATARGLAIGGGLLCLSLTFRSLDLPTCAGLPNGTHFLWHLTNAFMLGWMIETYRRHPRPT